jgi:hypothetical protein
MIFSRIPPKQCASRWLWGVLVIFFLAGSILIRRWLFRRVCHIQPYFLRFISTSIFDCPVFSHSSSLDIICGHQIPGMFWRHLITKACCFCVVLFVTNQVSQPYSRTDLTHGIEQLNFEVILILMLLALQIFVNLENAPLALFILCWTSYRFLILSMSIVILETVSLDLNLHAIR